MIVVSTKEVQVPGGKVFVKTWKPAQPHEVPLVLLHDSLGCVDTWREFPGVLAERCNRTVIAYDRLGFGKSDAREALPSTNFIAEESEIYLSKILHDLNIDRFSLFGHSVGGSMSVYAAKNLGKRCTSIISQSAQAFLENKTRSGIDVGENFFAQPESFARLAKYHGNKTQWVLDAWIKVWRMPEFKSWSLKSALAEVTCPVLAIHGDRDEYGSEKFPEMISGCAAGPSKMSLLRDCGHFPHREKPEEVLALVSDFLKLQK